MIGYRLYAMIAGGLALVLLLAWALRVDHLRAVHLKERQQLEQKYVAAQEKAGEREKAQKEYYEHTYKEMADAADIRKAEAYADGRAAADAYIRSHRVQPQAAGGACGRTAAAAPDRRPESGDGPGGTAQLAEDGVVVAAADINICTLNTARLVKAREWGMSLENSQ